MRCEGNVDVYFSKARSSNRLPLVEADASSDGIDGKCDGECAVLELEAGDGIEPGQVFGAVGFGWRVRSGSV